VDVLRLVNACRRTAAWAEQQGRLHTALEFSQAAALVAPDSASLAFGVGRVARRMAEYDRAESWYTRAVVQARESSNWRTYASALLGMGNLHRQRGNYPAAKRSYLRCQHHAERYRMRDFLAATYHSLFGIAVEMQQGLDADILAVRAIEAYDPGNPDVHRLAHDLAHHWNLHGYFSGALKVGVALARIIADPTMHPTVQSLIARAAGGVGDREMFDAAVDRVDDLLSNPAIPEEMAARSLLGLAHGALNLGDLQAAARYAEEAASIARKRKEGRVELEAEAVREAAERGALAQARSDLPAPEPELAETVLRVLARSEAIAA
jgi:tetratricopeptide (TPR) repeat protein